MKNAQTVLMAVGSSGGHIYPALAVAENLIQLARSHHLSLKIHFVFNGASPGKEIFSSLNYPVHVISLGGLARGQSLGRKIKTLLKAPKALLLAVVLIIKLRAGAVFGTGGAISGIALLAGVLTFRKTALWEGNAVMGLANRLIAPFARVVFTVFPIGKNKKRRKTAYPLRPFNKTKAPLAGKVLAPLPSKIFKVLILGGSQGSLFINDIVCRAIEGEKWRSDIFIYHQTGASQFAKIKEKYRGCKGIEPFAFSQNIGQYYRACDIVVSRAGAGAIAESAYYGKALILVPLTHCAGGHQLQNAKKLYAQKAIEMIQEKDFTIDSFKGALLKLKENPQKRADMALALKKIYKGNGAKTIAEWILSSLK